MIRPIRIYPDPVLRVRCPEVEAFDDELRRLADDMVETMHDAPGIGLAAPQVGVETRLIVVDLSVGEDPEQVHVLANPEVLERDGEGTELEGCLSIPGISDKVARARSIRVRAQDPTGETVELDAEDWLARAILHEIDHLDGVLFVDHLRGLRRERVKRQLKKLAEGGDLAREEALA
ncbi:MAG: peptide deformylase [Acidobacteriota bacterium]|jgi:peptide deformylase